jgi:hypothetical protein
MSSVTPSPVLEHGEMRYALRYAGTELARLPFSIRREGESVDIPVQVYDFTARGFAIRLAPETWEKWKPTLNEKVELSLQWQQQNTRPWRFRCLVAHLNADNEGRPLLGLRREFQRDQQSGTMEMRQIPRIHLPSSLGLSVTTPHPILYGHQTRLRLIDINLGMGYCLETQDPLFWATEGCTMAFHFSIPGFAGVQVMARATWIQPVDKQRMRIGVQTVDMPYELYQAICRFLLTSQIVSPSVLREAGFYVRHVREDIRFRQANRLEEYAEVLALRRQALFPDLTEDWAVPIEKMSFESDAQSRILTAWHGEKLIGSLTLYFPNTLHADSDLSGCVHQGDDSFPLPIMTECIEMRQLCVIEDFRGTDVLQGLIVHAMKAFLLSDRQWFLVAVQKDQIDFYLNMGFQDKGVCRRLSESNALSTHILTMQRNDLLAGHGMTFWGWNLRYGPLAEYVMHRELIPIPAWLRLRIQFRLAFSRLAHFFYGKKLRSDYQAHLMQLRQPVPPFQANKKPRSDWSAVP